MSEAATPETGALSFDQAVASLLPQQAEPEETNNAPEAPAEVAEEPEPQGGDQPPEEADAEPAEPAEDEETETEEAAVEPLEPPKYWSKDAKDRFADLPPELQAVVLEQEGPREAAAAKAKAEAAEETKAARAQLQGVQTLAEQLDAFLPEAIETFQRRWGDPDWEATIEQYGAEQAAKLKARYEREQSQLQQLTQANQAAQQKAHHAYVLEQFQALATLDPELAPDVKDPTQGAEKRQEVTKYLVAAGVDPQAIGNISAVEMTLARKAMLWDDAQAKLKAAPPKPKNPAPRAAPVRPGAAQAQSPAQRTVASAQGRFHAKPSIDNAVALLLAKKA